MVGKWNINSEKAMWTRRKGSSFCLKKLRKNFIKAENFFVLLSLNLIRQDYELNFWEKWKSIRVPEMFGIGKRPTWPIEVPFWGLSKLLGFWYSWYSHTLLLHFYDAYRCHEIACTVFHWCIQSNIVLPLFSKPRRNCRYFLLQLNEIKVFV